MLLMMRCGAYFKKETDGAHGLELAQDSALIEQLLRLLLPQALTQTACAQGGGAIVGAERAADLCKRERERDVVWRRRLKREAVRAISAAASSSSQVSLSLSLAHALSLHTQLQECD